MVGSFFGLLYELMAYTPISSQTQRDHRVLLGTSSLAILVEVFELRIDKIPIDGVSVSAPDQMLSVTLFCAIVYLLIAFHLRISNDLRNKDEEPSQVETRSLLIKPREERMNDFVRGLSAQIREELGQAPIASPMPSVRSFLQPYFDGRSLDANVEISRLRDAIPSILRAARIEVGQPEEQDLVEALLLAAKEEAAFTGKTEPDLKRRLQSSRRPERYYLGFERWFPYAWSAIALLMLLGVPDLFGLSIIDLLPSGSPATPQFPL